MSNINDVDTIQYTETKPTQRPNAWSEPFYKGNYTSALSADPIHVSTMLKDELDALTEVRRGNEVKEALDKAWALSRCRAVQARAEMVYIVENPLKDVDEANPTQLAASHDEMQDAMTHSMDAQHLFFGCYGPSHTEDEEGEDAYQDPHPLITVAVPSMVYFGWFRAMISYLDQNVLSRMVMRHETQIALSLGEREIVSITERYVWVISC